MLEWTRSDTLALASHRCVICHGLGLRSGKKETPSVCACVLRAIFRLCYARFKRCTLQEKCLSRVTMEFTGKGTRRMTWGRKNEEYCADFLLVTKRTLTPEEYRLFNYHLLLGADWKLCCRKLAIDRGNFFHSLYRIQAKLGKTFRELKPYSLFPLDEYFSTNSLREYEPAPLVYPLRREGMRHRWSIPLRNAA